MEFLKRSIAPLTSMAWEFIDSEARRVLRTSLRARRFVDVIGPKGWDYSAVNLGRLEIGGSKAEAEHTYGIRTVLPLVELRIPFLLDIWELDNLSRGADQIEVEPLHDAARAAARFEDTAVIKGFGPGRIEGLSDSSPRESLELRMEASEFLDTLSKGLLELQRAAVEGPYAMAVGPEPFRFLARSLHNGYPLLKRVERLLAGTVVETDILDDEGLLLSKRGGDFQLTLGQDLSIGYEYSDAKEVRLFFTESFTFRTLESSAVIGLKLVS